jgi:hypothetical protein
MQQAGLLSFSLCVTFLTLIHLAIQALVSSLVPRRDPNPETPSREDISRLSDKLTELLGGADIPQDTARRNERGEVCAHAGMQ